jgi:hypothetical protein
MMFLFHPHPHNIVVVFLFSFEDFLQNINNNEAKRNLIIISFSDDNGFWMRACRRRERQISHRSFIKRDGGF